jgi:16S rRNA (guanine966-N2)-methyltransferase
MRIISGELKGRSLNLPKGSRTRPATGQVRELLMSLLGEERLAGQVFLDLCAGTGITGLEAISRGAARAVFVETDSRMAAQLRETISHWNLGGRAITLQQDARRCWRAVAHCLAGELIGAAFLDPPFIPGMAADLLHNCGKGQALFAPSAYLVVRSPEKLPAAVHGFNLDQRRGRGPATLWCYTPVSAGLLAGPEEPTPPVPPEPSTLSA